VAREYKRKYFLNAFTLIEMIIAIMLGTIIVSFSYRAYINIQSEWKIFCSRENKVISLLLFKEAMDNDIEKAISISVIASNHFRIIILSDTINYLFQSNVVRSCKNSIDSFDISVENIRFNYVSFLKQYNIADEINIDVSQPTKINDIHFIKKYTSAELMSIYKQPGAYGY